MKLTDEKVRWFWEQCGLNYFDGWFYSPEGERLFEYGTVIDIWALPYLFLYAVPKLVEKVGKREAYLILATWLWNFIFKQQTDVMHLFEEIYNALGGKE